MSGASKELEAKRRESAFEGFKQDWWWFNPGNRKHIHEFSAAWEILRRTKAYLLLYDRMRSLRSANAGIEGRSFVDFVQRATLRSSLPDMLPQSPPTPRELCDMLGRWQDMIANGWTREKTYLEASQNSTVECVLPDGRAIRIPSTHGPLNQGIPVILPRQVTSKGHTALFVELCEIAFVPGQTPNYKHLAGPCAPTDALEFMRRKGKSIRRKLQGNFVVVEFQLHRPAQALKALFKSGLDSIEKNTAWQKPSDQPDRYSRPPHLENGTNALEAIAFFPATDPRNVIERGFRTLIRPERLRRVLPLIRKKWIEWESAERARYGCALSRAKMVEEACVAWKEAETFDKLVHQSTARPIIPAKDLDNLACAACAQFYNRNRSHLPDALPERLRNDPDLNKRIKTGMNLISSQDDVFLPLLKAMPIPSV